eukprot:4912879-Alexandrium_andersonii.AAC.1
MHARHGEGDVADLKGDLQVVDAPRLVVGQAVHFVRAPMVDRVAAHGGQLQGLEGYLSVAVANVPGAYRHGRAAVNHDA